MAEEETWSTDDAPKSGLVRVVEPQDGKKDISGEDTSIIETSQLQPTEAFDIFASKTFEKRLGSDVSRSTIGNVDQFGNQRSNVETPFARFFRLKAEIAELEADLDALTFNSSSSSSSSSSCKTQDDDTVNIVPKNADQSIDDRPNEMLKQMRTELTTMRARLARAGDSPAMKPLITDPIRQSAGLVMGAESQQTEVTSHELLKLVSSLRERANEGSSDSSLTAPSTGEVPRNTNATYEIYCGAMTGSESELAGQVDRLQTLEQRVRKMEQAVGNSRVTSNSSRSSDALGCQIRDQNIRQALLRIENRVDRLDPEAVAAARKELRPLQAQLSRILADQKRHGSVTDPDQNDSSAIQQLFRRTQIIDDFGLALPELVSRLRSLHALHEQSILWVNRLAAAEGAQARIEDALMSDRETMEILKDSLARNMDKFKTNIESIEERFARIAPASGEN